MLKSLDDQFTALARVAKELNAVSDQVSSNLRAVEERLKTLGLGVEVQLDSPLGHIDDLEDDAPPDDEVSSEVQVGETFRTWSGRQHHLGYTKLAGAWRLVVRSYDTIWVLPSWDDPHNGNEAPTRRTFVSESPLLDASRDVRLAAAEQIDLLLAAIQQAAQDRVERLNKALAEKELPAPIHAADSAVSGRIGGAVKTRRRVDSARPS